VEFKAQIPLGLEDVQNPVHNVKEFRRYMKVDEGVALTALVAHKKLENHKVSRVDLCTASVWLT